MMNLKEIRESYEDVSGKLSAVIRQINFAGIAVVWSKRPKTDLVI